MKENTLTDKKSSLADDVEGRNAIGRAASGAVGGAPVGDGISEKLENFLVPVVEALGYEIIHLEIVNHRSKAIRLYIDHLTGSSKYEESIGVEDCAKVSRGVDAPLEGLAADASAESSIRSWLSNGFELEVSSPGVDRLLRREKDFIRFQGREIRVSLFRALTADELQNAEYFSRNPKQKNYLGELSGFQAGDILMKISPTMGSIHAEKKKIAEKKKAKVKGSAKALEKILEKIELVHIPLALVAKANLEPVYDIIEDGSPTEISLIEDSGELIDENNTSDTHIDESSEHFKQPETLIQTSNPTLNQPLTNKLAQPIKNSDRIAKEKP